MYMAHSSKTVCRITSSLSCGATSSLAPRQNATRGQQQLANRTSEIPSHQLTRNLTGGPRRRRMVFQYVRFHVCWWEGIRCIPFGVNLTSFKKDPRPATWQAKGRAHAQSLGVTERVTELPTNVKTSAAPINPPQSL